MHIPDPRDVSVAEPLLKMVCELVDRSEFVVIKTHATDDGASFAINVHPEDAGKIIGKQGRNADSLRIILSAVGMKIHRQHLLEFARDH